MFQRVDLIYPVLRVNNVPFLKVFILLLILFLSGCSGGGVETNDQKPDYGRSEIESEQTGTQTGYLGSVAISGVQFQTESHAGVTGEGGRFEYETGESITFTLGATELGMTVPAKKNINLFDLVELEIVRGFEEAEEKMGDTGLVEVVNLAVMLETFDQDGNADNGIDISPEIGQLFDDINLRFYGYYYEFLTNFKFRSVLSQANQQGLFASERKVSVPWFVMDRLYDSLGVDPEFFIESSYLTVFAELWGTKANFKSSFDSNGFELKREIDDDADGYTDRVVFSEYDHNGYRIKLSEDEDADGLIDWTEKTIFHELEVVSSYQIDEDADGTADFGGMFTINDYGKVTKEEYDENADGVGDHTVMVARYDAQGNRVYSEVDYDRDGIPDQIIISAYDDFGNLIRHEKDLDGDGSPEYISDYAFDSVGNWIFDAFDSDGDGSPDRINRWVYDDKGLLLLREYDNEGDGKPDSIDSFTYDETGNLTSEENDQDGDGEPDKVTSVAYSQVEEGLKVRYDTDRDGDGLADSGYFTIHDHNKRLLAHVNYLSQISDITSGHYYSYDAMGNKTSDAIDSNGDGAYEYEFQLTYREDGSISLYRSSTRDSSGQLMYYLSELYDRYGNTKWKEYDSNGDGQANGFFSSTLDSDGNVISSISKTDSDSDGQVDSTYRYSFDSRGRRTKYEEDSDGDSVMDRIEIYSYDNNNNQTYLSFDEDADGHPEYDIRYTFDPYGNQTGYVVTEEGIEQINIQQTYQRVGWHWIFNGHYYQ